MLNPFRLLLFFMLITSAIHAQDWNEIYYLESDAQYFIEEKEYDKAIDIYRKIIKEIPEHSLAKYKIGKLYLLTDDQKDRSIEYFEEASQNIAKDFDAKSVRETKCPTDVFLYLGEAYQIQNKIDEAITSYSKFKDLITSNDKLFPVVIQRLKTCENAKIVVKNPMRVVSKNLGTPLNNGNSNFSAVISGDGKTMIHTAYTRNYIDIYSSKLKNNVWSSPKKITDYVSNKYYLKTSCLSYDGQQLYLVTDDPEANDIFVSYKEGNSWTNAEKLGKNINGKKSNETHVSISKDGNTLYFTSNREGGFGGLDIYKSTLDAKGKWGEPENLGPAINTEFDEETPFVTLDDKYLLFSSQGHSSIGGFDIFYIDLESKSMAINLGYPANTTGDDLFFIPDNSLTSGYISKHDNASLGKKDIYYISVLPKINFAGNIKNEINGEKITGSGFDISVIETKTNNLIESINTNNGLFEFEINPGNYTLTINNEGYDSFSNEINISNDYSESTYSFDALLNPLESEQELVAEVIEQTDIEPVVEEEIIPQTTEEVIQEVQTVEKTVVAPVKENLPTENKEKPKPIKPEKEIVKYVPKTTIISGIKTYSVQLMALKNPVEVDYFKDVNNVKLTKYPDGFYRYTVGNTSSYSEAQQQLSQLHKIGYKNAFITTIESTPKYTIQLMALIIPVKPEFFKDLSSVVVTKGSDDYFRYTIGSFNTYEEAKQELTNLNSRGYAQAFVKKNK